MNILNNGLFSRLLQENTIETGSNVYYAVLIGFIVFSAVISYLLGSLNSSIIVSRILHGEDIRNHGSGNAGLTNTFRTYGKSAAALTLLGDMLKTALSILITAVLFGFSYKNGISMSGFCYLSGLFAVLGHVFPVFYKFKGGKGVLVTATMALILTPWVFVALIIIFIVILLTTEYVSLGSIIVATLFPFAVCAYSYFLGGGLPVLTAVCSVALGIFVIWCHRSNISRLRNGTEKKIKVCLSTKKD